MGTLIRRDLFFFAEINTYLSTTKTIFGISYLRGLQKDAHRVG